jgi:5-hydroxyisourate hydrolase
MISTQVIDTALGHPAANIPIVLDYFVTGHGWREIGDGVTDPDGIIETFAEDSAAGLYRLTFDIAAYQPEPFFPSINVTFEITNTEDDCHLALYLGPYTYSISRG